MNRVVEISEVGPDDGKVLAIRVEGDRFYANEVVSTMDGDRRFRVEYVATGRKNATGNEIFKRTDFREELT